MSGGHSLAVLRDEMGMSPPADLENGSVVFRATFQSATGQTNTGHEGDTDSESQICIPGIE